MSYPTITNDPVTIKEAIDFINNWNTIITNSYHGMYWSYLLGKEVICIPFSSGHYNFNGKIRYTTEENAHLLAESVQGGSSDKISDSKHEERITAHRIVALFRKKRNSSTSMTTSTLYAGTTIQFLTPETDYLSKHS